MTALYELAILGKPPAAALADLHTELKHRLAELGLDGPDSANVYIGAANGFNPSGSRCCASVCFQSDPADDAHIEELTKRGIPIVPIATEQARFSSEVPSPIRGLNGLSLDKHSSQQIVAALLECADLLPRQRRVFLSYRREQATDVALQLHAELSAHGFDVFLDTHKIHPGEHFQEILWQRLCDCEVLIMLDTKDYFNSRWTSAEFGRAMARGLAFVRVGWPLVVLSPRAHAADNLELSDGDFIGGGRVLQDMAVTRICCAVEAARTKSVGMRYQNLIDTLESQLKRVGAAMDGVSLRRRISITLADGKRIDAFPVLGVPSTYSMQGATMDSLAPPVAVIYDDVGMEDRGWRDHMEWICPHLSHLVRLVPTYKAGWDFSDWHAS